jgi:hypothetical protein
MHELHYTGEPTKRLVTLQVSLRVAVGVVRGGRRPHTTPLTETLASRRWCLRSQEVRQKEDLRS